MSNIIKLIFALLLASVSQTAAAQDPLPSWNDGIAKKAIVEFVTKVTAEGSADFVPPVERIATFDNDGTLWVEQPMYTQLAFALDRVKALAPAQDASARRRTEVLTARGRASRVVYGKARHRHLAGTTKSRFAPRSQRRGPLGCEGIRWHPALSAPAP